MAKQNKEIISEEIGEDLCTLAQLLISEGLCNDTSALDNAGRMCSTHIEKNKWKYSLGKLDFSLDEVGSTIPFDATDLLLRFSISINGKLIESEEVHDPLDDLTFDIEILGSRLDEESGEIVELYCSWHLDRHISKPHDGPTKYSHPSYHFTFGGRKMEAKGQNFGSCLILPSPRLAHPPMDAILGIDFILKNYFHKNKIKNIINTPEYIDIVHKSQERLWLPYFSSITSKWLNFGKIFNSQFTYNKLFPFLHKN